ncbi:MAG: agmatinase [Planctomycetota bacterium]|nr:agmatinase [Planctomycetota bacterium]
MPTDLPSGRVQPRFAGIATFMRVPLLALVRPEHQPVDWVIYGVPFDGGTTYHPGARFGPRAIRDASQYIKPINFEAELDLAREFSMADGGDAPVAPFSCEGTLESVVEFAEDLGDPSRTKLLALGGDHSIALANIRVAWERAGRPASGLPLLHFDAHLDTAEAIWDERYGHASFLRRGIEDGCIDPERTLSIGFRGPLNTMEDLEYATGKGIEVVPMSRWIDDRKGVDRSIAQWRASINQDPVYVTFDIDCIDPAFAPGTGTPCCGGFSTAEVLSILRRFETMRLAGADVVEVCPSRDVAEITALAASHVAFEILSLDAGSRG